MSKGSPMMSEAVERSRAFYHARGLEEWAEALPHDAEPSAEAESMWEQAQAEGFTLAWAFPNQQAQLAMLPALVEAMAGTVVDTVPEGQQYTEPWFTNVEEIQAAPSANRPDGPYLLLMQAGQYPAETRNKKAPELLRMFEARGWSGLTVPEYLVLQRRSLMEHGDHRFDDYVRDVEQSQWMWLLDTHLPGHCVQAYWNPGKQRIEVAACKVGSKNERRGAHPTIVVPLT